MSLRARDLVFWYEKMNSFLRWYSRIWALQQLLLLQNFASNFESSFEIGQGLAMIGVLFVPNIYFFSLALLSRIVATLIKMPYVHDSKNWWLQTDLAVLILLWTKQEERIVPTVQRMMSIYYFFAAFWKVNTSFLDHRYSCASIFVAQLVAAYLPHSFVVESKNELGYIISRTSPYLTLSIEFACALTIWQNQSEFITRIGICLALLLHFGIAITPSPNAIVSFGVGCLVRLFLLLDPDSANNVLSAAFMLKSSSFILPFIIWGGAALVATTFVQEKEATNNPLDPTAEGAGLNRALFLFAALAIIILLSTFSKCTKKTPKQSNFFFILLAFCYGLGGPLTGIQDLGSATMFANFRMFGGSNHYLLPAALLQRFEIGPYSGGLIRVEDTNSTWIRHITNYPGDLTSAIAQEARDLLAAGGHSTKYFNAMLNVESSPRIYPQLLSDELLKSSANQNQNVPNIRFTIPASDLQRLIYEARHINESFSLTYAQLPGTTGDELWRSYATKSLHEIHFNQTGHLVHCLTDDAPCDSDMIENFFYSQPAWILKKLLLAMPYPILEDNATELHCFGP
uniref:Uncharacterized protein n=1 Tax=Aureoumbra lagunensis TaxID=44058 RepID=A0A7S3NJ07_9STRA|mmetsp:Transcript_7707/g.11650  ORF Transcript_7707/g.11650 Transcript_7707/m.11650 type:complete len:570 (-) Transcript_7707:240-1949(-)